MNPTNPFLWMLWLEQLAKILAGFAGLGFFVAAISYRNQVRIRRAEWLKSLFEKFFESGHYKEARFWLDYGRLDEQLNVPDEAQRTRNEEKFTDFLNFFEFIGVLHARGQLTLEELTDVFDYYLKKIKSDANCRVWIERYGFEKLKRLTDRIA